MSEINNIKNLRLFGTHFSLKNHTIIKITGEDRERYLQGQLSNDVLELKLGESQLTARLNRGGKLLAWGHLVKREEDYLFLIENDLTNIFLEDISKFIIMDDVEFSIFLKEPLCELIPKKKRPLNEGFNFNYLGENTFCYLDSDLSSSKEMINKDLEKILRCLSGYPSFNLNIFPNQLVNETILNELGISYSKGCFLGQEAVSKIETRRGAANYPVLFILNEEIEKKEGEEIFSLENKKVGKVLLQSTLGNKSILQVKMNRNYRVTGKVLTLKIKEKEFQGKIQALPYFDPNHKVQDFFEYGIKAFQEGDDAEAIKILKEVIKLNPNFSDAYESIGVILGRNEKYEEALEYMELLLKSNPDSVMAHTNKSLYLMKLGKIEEAEEEKSKATIASFSLFGKEAEIKRKKEEEEKRNNLEIEKREAMFKQVIEIDPDDSLANYGLGDINFHRGKFSKALFYLDKVLKEDSKHSVAYLLLGKTFKSLGNFEKAKKTFEDGIEIATSNGDFMPANEMQALLLKLN